MLTGTGARRLKGPTGGGSKDQPNPKGRRVSTADDTAEGKTVSPRTTDSR